MVFAAEVLVQRGGHLVASDSRGLRGEDTPEAERRYLGSAPADVDDHVGAPRERVEPAADRPRNGLGNQVDATNMGLFHSLDERSPLERRRTAGYTDNAARMQAFPRPPVDASQDRRNERTRGVEVGDHPVTDGTDRFHSHRRPSDEFPRRRADQQCCPMVVGAHHHDRGFVEHDCTVGPANHCVGRAQIDAVPN